ncbi:MAG: flagellar motor switch protein FliG [Peptococcaceae bacterium]|jgi:flagellar motor switch protein FliG|nr:flagellar motor switch protein FliG [Peptococcaceae bacterium]
MSAVSSVSVQSLNGLQKAAVLLVSLGSDCSAQIIKNMGENEIEQLTLEMANMRKVSSDTRDEVVAEFHHMCVANDYIAQGGVDYAREVLERALGQEKAFEIIAKLSSSLKMRPFDMVQRTDPLQLATFIHGEHPQTIALIMSYMHPEKAAALLANLPLEIQSDVTKRVAVMGRTNPEVLKTVEKILDSKISSLAVSDHANLGGIPCAVNFLNRSDPGTLKTVMDQMETEDPDLAEQIKRQMFVFEDIVTLDDRGVQLILREIETKDLALALKGTNADVAQKVQNNMSSRAAQMLKEDIEFMGPVRLRDVEDAQQRVVKVIRKLEETGTIVISRGGAGDIVY